MDIRNVTKVIVKQNSVTLVFGSEPTTKTVRKSRKKTLTHYRPRHLLTRITQADWDAIDEAVRKAHLNNALKSLYDLFKMKSVWQEKELTTYFETSTGLHLYSSMTGRLNACFRKAGIPHRILVDPETRYNPEFAFNRTYRVYKLKK